MLAVPPAVLQTHVLPCSEPAPGAAWTRAEGLLPSASAPPRAVRLISSSRKSSPSWSAAAAAAAAAVQRRPPPNRTGAQARACFADDGAAVAAAAQAGARGVGQGSHPERAGASSPARTQASSQGPGARFLAQSAAACYAHTAADTCSHAPAARGRALISSPVGRACLSWKRAKRQDVRQDRGAGREGGTTRTVRSRRVCGTGTEHTGRQAARPHQCRPNFNSVWR